MQFGFKTAPQETTWPEMLSVWQHADGMGVWESGWTFDHFYPIFTDSSGPCLEGWVTTTALAQATTNVRIGVLVTGIVYRHPAVLANMAATLDIISGGRLELGLGAGWNEEECDAYGIELGTLNERFDRFDEALEVIDALLTNETSDFAGRYFQLRNARCEPKPLQSPLPICIGGAGETRTLPAAARWAQHWNAPAGDADFFAAKRAVLHECCARIGRDPGEIRTSVHLRLFPDTDLSAFCDEAAAFAAAGCDLGIVYLSPPHVPARLDAAADALRDAGLLG